LFHGLAGIGNALLDVADLSGRPDVRAEAWRTAEGILLFGVESPEGLGFAGEQSLRESAIRKIGDVVQAHPEEAMAIVRTWLHHPT